MLQDWFVNLSSTDIPLKIQYLLLGKKFSLPINQDNKEKILVEFIKYMKTV